MNRRHRPARPEDQQPLPDSGELQRDVVRYRQPPSLENPQPQPPYVTVPDYGDRTD